LQPTLTVYNWPIAEVGERLLLEVRARVWSNSATSLTRRGRP